MNGFTNAILSLLLSWIRVIINHFWQLFNSEAGEKLVSFLSKNWLIFVLIIAGGSLIIDIAVYLMRWRPDIVWRNRRRKKQQQWDEEYEDEQPTGYQWEADTYPDDDMVYRSHKNAGYATVGFQPVRGQRALDVETQRIAPYVTPPSQQLKDIPGQNPSVQENHEDFDPVFDDDAPVQWTEGDTLVSSAVPTPAQPNHGVAQGIPATHFRHVQAGYAPPVPPEQMYAPQVSGQESLMQVHPGLDADSLRKNIGLSPAGSLRGDELPEETAEAEEIIAINTNPLLENDTQTRSQTFFTTLARRARDLMGTGENDSRSIYDLQPPTDIHSGFREPVYPKAPINKEDDSPSNF